jgi:DNA-binding HxlR family transcriptional regulator
MTGDPCGKATPCPGVDEENVMPEPMPKASLDLHDAACPGRQALDRIADRWTILVLLALADGPMRFTELARRIERVSQKMLTQTLRGLERDGLLTRTVHASVPPRVDYELTPLGRTLDGPITAVQQWALDHMGDVLTARAAYDAQHARPVS